MLNYTITLYVYEITNQISCNIICLFFVCFSGSGFYKRKIDNLWKIIVTTKITVVQICKFWNSCYCYCDEEFDRYNIIMEK